MLADLTQIQTFIHVVDFNSFTKAADYLSISRSMVSIRIKELEEKLGVSLLIRSTRTISLTDSGATLYENFKAIFSTIEQAFECVQTKKNKLSGIFRITSTNEYGRQYILPLIQGFCEAHPDIDLHFYFDSSVNDLISDKLDLAIRLGTLKDSSLKSRKIKNYQILLTATPQFIKKHELNTIKSVQNAPWITNSNLTEHSSWRLTHPTLEEVHLFSPRGKYVSNAASAVREMTLASLGVSICPAWLVADDIASGKLVRVLPDYSLPQQAIYALFPNSSHTSLKTRVFIDYLIAHLVGED